MVPLDGDATGRILAWDDGLHRTVALHHAAIRGRPGLWGDHPSRPSSVIWLREGDGQWEAFAAGFAGPALDWLAAEARGRPIALAAPPSWEAPVLARAGRSERRFVQTWVRPGPWEPPIPSIATRRLGPEDAGAFEEVTPAWGLRAWGDFAGLIDAGAAFGAPTRLGFGALAWIVESDHHCDKIGVATIPRFRRLGLGRASASALLGHIARDRRKHPLWTTNPGNAASLALARSLGFSAQVTETVLGWTPG